MQGIKTSICLLALVLVSCFQDDDTAGINDVSFVRFFLTTDANGDAIEYPVVITGAQAVTNFTKDNVLELKIPVALSYPMLDDEVTVTFAVEGQGDLDVTINPENTITFNQSRVVDTIFVTINERWDLEKAPQLTFELLSVSDPIVSLGMPDNNASNSSLIVGFGDPALQYGFATNRIEIDGTIGEKITFDVVLPQGYFPEEIHDDEIFNLTSGFEFAIDRLSQTPTKITYQVTISEDLQNDFLPFVSTLQLVESEDYQIAGITFLQIVKPVKTVRDVSTNPAAHFYNLDDEFHRTYGENWLYNSTRDQCEWSTFFAFSFPVVVDSEDENAVLYDDLGNDDPSDDIYHHAFKIGFDTPVNPDLTTNSFNLKRWFNNESSRSENSPGFNINPAIEFFPENGTSTTNGTVLVEQQIIAIGSTDGNSYAIEISGEGTYRETEPGLFEISLTFNAKNEELFGGTVSSEYLMYNQINYPEPLPLTNSNCVTPVDL
ncbi:MAG: hypothetical protein AAFQ94_18775 [Bacteroidota bacterium]